MNEGIFDSGKWDRARVQIIESTQRVPVMAGATHVSFLLLGGGGGGGSGKLDTTPATANGGAGGSGAGLQYRRRMPLRLMQLFKMLSFDVVIGAGGTAGAAQTSSPTNGNPGGTGGSSRIEFQFLTRGPTQNGQNTVRLNVSGGGNGTGGTNSFANATATGNNSGQINGITGGQGSSLSQQGGHSGNSFGTNPWHWIAVSGGISGNGAGFNAQNQNPGLHTFYGAGYSSPTQAGNDNGPDAVSWAKPVWDFVLADWKTAPTLEELAWLTLSGGVGGNSSSSGAGGAGGKGYRGSGGGGGAGAHYTASGSGGAGGNGVAVFWWERLV